MNNEAWENHRCPNCGKFGSHAPTCGAPMTVAGQPFLSSSASNYAQPFYQNTTMSQIPVTEQVNEREWLDRQIFEVRRMARV